MLWSDTKNRYGGISIFLHWLAAAVIIALWGIGDWMQGAAPDSPYSLRKLHISIAATAYIFIIFRILWRVKSSHPKLDGQNKLTHYLAKTMHYLLLFAIAMMLASGPTMLWSAGLPVAIFETISIPSPLPPTPWLNRVATSAHGFFANAVIILTLLHISGAFKHLMFNNDETFISMLIPAKREQ